MTDPQLLREIESDLKDVQDDLKALTKKIESAFPKNEDGDIDYAAHRLYHKKQDAEAAAYSASKNKILRDIISWAAIGALTIIGSALVHTYLVSGGSISLVK